MIEGFFVTLFGPYLTAAIGILSLAYAITTAVVSITRKLDNEGDGSKIR